MRIKRILASGIAVLALAGTLAACGDDSDDDNTSEENSSQTTEEETTDEGDETTEEGTDPEEDTDEGTDPEEGTDGGDPAASGDATVTVDGEPLAGLDTSNIQCVKQGGKISVGSADADASLGLVMTDEATPKVESLGIMVDGITLAVSQVGGSELGSAEVAVDGDTYTVTGTAAGTDTEDPTTVLEKEFEIVVTC